MPSDKKSSSEKREEELIRACQRNERLAQSEFFRLYSGKFLGITMRFAGNQDTANDLLQESFIKIFKSIDKYSFSGSFEGWMRKIVIHTSIDFMKKHGKLRFDELDQEFDSEISDAADCLEKLNCEAIISEISRLPEGFRTILNLYAIEGYSYPEISAMLNIKEVTVRSQYMRAKQKLAIALQKKNIAYYVRKFV